MWEGNKNIWKERIALILCKSIIFIVYHAIFISSGDTVTDRNVNITEVHQRQMKICNLPPPGIEPGTSRLKDERVSV